MLVRASSGSGGGGGADFEEVVLGQSTGFLIDKNNSIKTSTSTENLLLQLTDAQSASVSGGRMQLIFSKTKYIIGTTYDTMYNTITTITAGTPIPFAGWSVSQAMRFYDSDPNIT